MSENIKIKWCDHAWSPWRGWGNGATRVPAKDWGKPVRWNENPWICPDCGKAFPAGAVQFDEDCFCKPRTARGTTRFRPAMVFPSLCDWLDDEVPANLLARFLALIHDTPNLRWLLLTKRPENWDRRKWAIESEFVRGMKNDCDAAVGKSTYKAIRNEWSSRSSWISEWVRGNAPSNVWVGTSVEDHTRASKRIPDLLDIPAAGRFLSVEPLLGPVDLSPLIVGDGSMLHVATGSRMCGISWVIVGGESGPGSRPCNVEWVRSLVRQCAAASVPCFVKQLGASPMEEWWEHSPECEDDLCANGGGIGDCAGQVIESQMKLTHPKGGDPAEWPDDLRVRQFPEALR